MGFSELGSGIFEGQEKFYEMFLEMARIRKIFLFWGWFSGDGNVEF